MVFQLFFSMPCKIEVIHMSKLAERMTSKLTDLSNTGSLGISNIYAVINVPARRAAANSCRPKRIAEEFFNMKYVGEMS